MDVLSPLAHLLSVEQLSRSQVEQLLALAAQYQREMQQFGRIQQPHPDLLVAHLFFEPSTRTCNSFEIAAMRLGAKSLTPRLDNSSLEKGETLEDTVNNLAAMGVNSFVIRHHDNQLLHHLATQLRYPCHLISAGAGSWHHPSQTLLDLYTIQQFKSNWATLRVAIVGDLRHSRVARSLITGLHRMGTRDIRLVCPEYLTLLDYPDPSLQHITDLRTGLADVDVVVCLRLQRERLQAEHLLDEAAFFANFIVDERMLAYAKPEAIVMHPGPINRNCEIASTVADGPQSVILRQVENSIPVRMAILKQFS